MICDDARQHDIRWYKGGWPLIRLPNGRFVEVTSTKCHYGGMRLWFVCPGCRRRCAILYPLYCRKCCHGRYRSELSSPLDRLLQKACRLCERLGEMEWRGLGHPLPPRPRGMHQTTYEGIVEQLGEIEDQVWEIGAARFGLETQ